jgi:hypothetical protein
MSMLIIDAYCNTHRLIESFLGKLSDAQLHWRHAPEAHSIAFHAWHVTRWADHFQAAVPGMTPELGRVLGAGSQIWYAEGIVARWGMEPVGSYDQTGMHMPDDAAVALRFPEKAEFIGYVSRVFVLAERAVRAIDEQQFASPEQPQPMTEGIWGGGTVGAAVMSHVTHANRHLGMMECLLGLQVRSGTATQ